MVENVTIFFGFKLSSFQQCKISCSNKSETIMVIKLKADCFLQKASAQIDRLVDNFGASLLEKCTEGLDPTTFLFSKFFPPWPLLREPMERVTIERWVTGISALEFSKKLRLSVTEGQIT